MSGDRHLRPDPEGRLHGRPVQPAAVRITADPDQAVTETGQHLLAMLVDLLARQFEIVKTISLDLPATPAHSAVFHGRAGEDTGLTAALIDLGRRVGAPSIATTAASSAGVSCTVRVHVGAGVDPSDGPIPALAVAADGWVMKATSIRALTASPPRSPNPLAALLTACVAAGYVFKTAFGRHRDIDLTLDLWPEPHAPEPASITLPAAYVLGLGAVGAAFGDALSRIPDLEGQLVAVDPQTMSATDRNRLVSGATEDVDTPKARLFERLFEHARLSAHPFVGKWPRDYLGDPDREVPEALRADEADGRFDWIISCVDRDTDRADIAARLPRHVLSGSTYGMLAQIISYSLEGPGECLACRHRPVRLATREQNYAQLRSMTSGERDGWYEARGAGRGERAAIETYLAVGDPSCAAPGAADLARLGVQGEVDWAVGFVSVAAGVLLAVRFLRAAALGARHDAEHGSEWRLYFWQDELDIHRAQRRPDCPVCRPAPESGWRALWDNSLPGSPPGT